MHAFPVWFCTGPGLRSIDPDRRRSMFRLWRLWIFLRFPSDLLLLIKGKGARVQIDQENQCYHELGNKNNASLQLFCRKSGFWQTCTGWIAQALSARIRWTSSGKRKEHWSKSNERARNLQKYETIRAVRNTNRKSAEIILTLSLQKNWHFIKPKGTYFQQENTNPMLLCLIRSFFPKQVP